VVPLTLFFFKALMSRVESCAARIFWPPIAPKNIFDALLREMPLAKGFCGGHRAMSYKSLSLRKNF
jgi:hypothetical protein